MPEEDIYAHFNCEGHDGLGEMIVQIYEKTDVTQQTLWERFRVPKLSSFVLQCFNLRDLD